MGSWSTYIQSYEGLVHLKVSSLTRMVSEGEQQSTPLATNIRQQRARLSAALESHRPTLLSFRVLCSDRARGGPGVRWALDEPTLESLEALCAIRTLEVVWMYRREGEGVDIPLVSGTITVP